MSEQMVKYYGAQHGNIDAFLHKTISCDERYDENLNRVHHILCRGVLYKAVGYMVCVNLTSRK